MDKGYSSRANRAWLRERGIAHPPQRPGRPIDFGDSSASVTARPERRRAAL
jgi:transposase InsO family protein